MSINSNYLKFIATSMLLFVASLGFSQSLPINFEGDITLANFENFDGGTADVIANPHQTGINTSATVAQIVRNGGAIWSGSKVKLANNLNFSTNSTISMKVFTTAPIGTIVKFKLEGNGATERDAPTTVTNAWETLKWDFTGTPSNFDYLVFMFDFGIVGNGGINSTFLFDDVAQSFSGTQINMPVTFEGTGINYTMTDFGGNVSSLVTDPTNANNKVMQVIKTNTAASWAGTTIGTAAGFSAYIPITLANSKMNVRVWTPSAGTPIRLKIEDSNDVTHTCETQTNTTVAGWETVVFNFVNQAAGTAALSTGLNNGWKYNEAAIFFNFGTEGSVAGEKTYYFDDVNFGNAVSGTSTVDFESLQIYPNPSNHQWTISLEKKEINSVEVFDLLGKQVLFVKVNNYSTDINASNLSQGTYIGKISTDVGSRFVYLIKG
jgi:Secretion system C-terminal sorting domain